VNVPCGASVLVMGAALLWACSTDQQTVCTASFAYITVYAHDGAGHPVPPVFTITDTIRRTGQSFTMSQDFNEVSPIGTYVIFDDNQQTRIRSSGDSVRVSGSGTAGRFSADYVFGVPDGCHVSKLSGPDSVLVSP